MSNTIIKSLIKKREKEWFHIDYKPKIKIVGPLNKEKIKIISEIKKEPKWMLKIRLKAFKNFRKFSTKKINKDIDFDNLIYYGSPEESIKPKKWKELPDYIKKVCLRLKLDQNNLKNFYGFQLQFDSNPIYRKILEKLKKLGVIFTSFDEALIEHEKLVKKYFGKLVKYNESEIAALNTAVWSGGVFIYVPENVKLKFPLHTHFRINLERFGQFERSLLIIDKNSEATFIEGCSSSIQCFYNLHAAVFEVFALENSKLNLITLQNWSKNVYNLPIKKCLAERNSKVRLVTFEIGGKFTIKQPTLLLKDFSIGEIFSLTFASKNQIFDTGGKIICLGKSCKGFMHSKGIAIEDGKIINRFNTHIPKGSKNSEIYFKCDGLIFDKGIFESIPKIECLEKNSHYNYEGEIRSIDMEKIFYLKSKGIEENCAMNFMILGFFEDILQKIPEFFRKEIQKFLHFGKKNE